MATLPVIHDAQIYETKLQHFRALKSLMDTHCQGLNLLDIMTLLDGCDQEEIQFGTGALKEPAISTDFSNSRNKSDATK